MGNIKYSSFKGKDQNPVLKSNGPGYSAGKNSSIVRGISCGKSGPSSKVDIGRSTGLKNGMENREPASSNKSKPFKGGSRA